MNITQSPAWIVTRRGASPVRCMVSGLTTTGGCIAVDTQVAIPERFALYTSFRSQRGRPCHVTGRKPGLIEFEFIPTKSDEERKRRSDHLLPRR